MKKAATDNSAGPGRPRMLRGIQLAVAATGVLACACQVAPYEVINIDIEEHPGFYGNLELARAISSYDRRYLAFRVPSYSSDFERSISVGAAADSSDGRRAFVWVNLDFNNGEMLEPRDVLKREIREYFAELAKEHKAKAAVFASVRGPGEHAVRELFAGRGQGLYADFASDFGARMMPEEWSMFCRETELKFGAPLRIGFSGEQYYRAFDDHPEHVSQLYVVEFADKEPVDVRVSLLEESGRWKVCGYAVAWRDDQ